MEQKRRVVIVGDEGVHIEQLERILAEPYEVVGRTRGEQALQTLSKSGPIDFALVVLARAIEHYQGSRDKDELLAELKERNAVLTEMIDTLDERVALRTEQLELANSSLSSALARITELAQVDELTELVNRRRLLELAALEIVRARRYGRALSLLMLDIDHFKSVNDRFGHAAGDRVLREVARRVRVSLRQIDVAGRYGGEEFVAMLPETHVGGAVKAAERLRIEIASLPIDTGEGSPVRVTVSIGVASLTPEDAIESLIARADQQLYRAKRDGRDRVSMAPEAAPEGAPER